ncbi:HAD hydrolase-like protein [Streptomyces johnsoniae]|uniref:HAD hydrolase-like protein n=1 Tax=Streptomyces johnsoniae TaxID=3075532 RepID=A0ABU2S9L9_9ACTN|nr:HAD hydrolase-like protein [Streptomyces sp. DSM 41886]MDT0445645.1 HAD hydrolase-like protein [Streptomyces sp. DSM 41886]
MAESTNERSDPPSAPRTAPGACASALCEAYDTALLDLDGVVYAGGDALPHAVASLRTARSRGMRSAYVTNNAARTPRTVADHLTRLGVPAEPAEVVTSAQAVARLIAEQLPAGARVLCAGGEGLRVALTERGLLPVDSADDDPAAVVQGYGGPELPWGVLTEAALAVNRGAAWFASNTDLTIPSGRGTAPGNGAAVEVVRIATGYRKEPRVAGKPCPPMHRESILRTGARRPLVVGDRLDTDIEGAHAGGVDSLLVLSGVTDAAELLAARPAHRPTYVAADLRGLLVAQPAPAPDGDGFACGGWRASVRAGRLELSGQDDDPLNGLRALCAAAWSAAGRERGTAECGPAVARLGL